MTRVHDIIRTLQTTPPLPAVSLRILEVIKDPDYSIDDVVNLVRTDPSLTARVLRLTNSAMMGITSNITTVNDAVTYLGTRNLVKLVLICCAANHFRTAVTSIYGQPNDLWRHTVAVATACYWIADHAGMRDSATAFTLGILHNIGKVALSQSTIADEVAPAFEHTATHWEAEWRIFGIDHADAAGVIADAWNLPRALAQALRDHHDLDRIDEMSQLSAVLSAGDDMVLAAGIGRAFPKVQARVSSALLERLALTEADIEDATAHVTVELETQAELLNLQDVTNR